MLETMVDIINMITSIGNFRRIPILMTVKLWWAGLCVISGINIFLWAASAVKLTGIKNRMTTDFYQWRRWIFWLSGIYVFGCAFRSIFPRIDLERIALVDSWLSSMLVGRSVATIAELCFIAQCAILLREASASANDKLALMISLWLLPIIVTAEGFSWYAVISTNYLGSVIEESLWTIAGILLIFAFISLWKKVVGVQRHFLSAMIVFAFGFVAFMVTVDVPLYWVRWQADSLANTVYLPFTQGLLDAAKNFRVTFEWTVWREEIPWMTLYFTIAVWISIYLTHAPSFRGVDPKITPFAPIHLIKPEQI